MAGRSVKRASFAATVARPERRASGRTWAPKTPLALRTSGLVVDPELRDRIHRRLGERLGKFAPRIERLTVRFEDVNGPRGGIDVACRIKAVISGHPSLIISELAANPAEAFDRAGLRLERVVRRAMGRSRERGHVGARELPDVPPEWTDQRKPGRAAASRAAASTATRNRKRRAPKATAALEGSARARPSRKSTRKSANRAKHGNKLARREGRRAASPKGRRARAASTH